MMGQGMMPNQMMYPGMGMATPGYGAMGMPGAMQMGQGMMPGMMPGMVPGMGMGVLPGMGIGNPMAMGEAQAAPVNLSFLLGIEKMMWTEKMTLS